MTFLGLKGNDEMVEVMPFVGFTCSMIIIMIIIVLRTRSEGAQERPRASGAAHFPQVSLPTSLRMMSPVSGTSLDCHPISHYYYRPAGGVRPQDRVVDGRTGAA